MLAASQTGQKNGEKAPNGVGTVLSAPRAGVLLHPNRGTLSWNFRHAPSHGQWRASQLLAIWCS